MAKIRFTQDAETLAEVSNHAQDDLVYLADGSLYRFFAGSTATPDGDTAVLPSNLTEDKPGRWISQSAGGGGGGVYGSVWASIRKIAI